MSEAWERWQGLVLLQAGSPSESHDSFFSSLIWVVVGAPFVIMLVIGFWNRKPKQTVREFDGSTFATDVLASEVPVLVHFYRSWSIGDQVLVAQVERLAVKAQGYGVGFLDVEKNPDVLSRHSHIEAPTLVLFAGGRRIFHCEGVVDEADVHREVTEAIARWERGRLAGTENS